MTPRELAEKIACILNPNWERETEVPRLQALESLLQAALDEAKKQEHWETLNKYLDEFMNEAMNNRIKEARAAGFAEGKSVGYEEGFKAALSKEIETGMAVMGEISEEIRKAKAEEVIESIRKAAFEDGRKAGRLEAFNLAAKVADHDAEWRDCECAAAIRRLAEGKKGI